VAPPPESPCRIGPRHSGRQQHRLLFNQFRGRVEPLDMPHQTPLLQQARRDVERAGLARRAEVKEERWSRRRTRHRERGIRNSGQGFSLCFRRSGGSSSSRMIPVCCPGGRDRWAGLEVGAGVITAQPLRILSARREELSECVCSGKWSGVRTTHENRAALLVPWGRIALYVASQNMPELRSK
jgi:hypothetical protein